MAEYNGPEVYPPAAWMDECKALVRHEQVWAIIESEWSWLEAWDTGFSPTYAVQCGLLDVLAPEVGASYTNGER